MTDIELPDPPPIRGLSFRTYQGPADIPGMVDVVSAVMHTTGTSEPWTEDTLLLEFEHPTHADPTRDVLLARVDTRIVAWSRVEWSDTTLGERLYWSVGLVHPAWRGQGIGTAMLGRDERRRAEIAAGHDHPGPGTLMSWVEDSDHGALALLAGRGYERVRTYLHMVRPDMEDIDVPPLPPGLRLRPVTPETLPRVWDGLVEAFRDHFGGHDGSVEAFRRWSEDPDFDLDLLVVAFDRDEVAGGVHGLIHPAENRVQGVRRGWVDPIFTRQPWRRRGLASALLGHALLRLRDRGMTSAQLDVDAQNPNRAGHLYERHGFRTERSSSEWRKPLDAL